MKRLNSLIALLLCCGFILSACGGNGESRNSFNENSVVCLHVNKDTVVVEDATCLETGLRQYKCLDCDEVFSESIIDKKGHRYIVDAEKSIQVTCSQDGMSVKSCEYCGKVKEEKIDALGHDISDNIAIEYVKEYNEAENYIELYKSCKNGCGEISATTFRVDVDARENYMPTSPTVTMYETRDKLSYGFTWNTKAQPFASGIMLVEKGESDWRYYAAEAIEDTTYESDAKAISVYISKAVVELEPNVAYEYKLVENFLKVESDTFSFTAVNPKATSFSFASFSDTQNLEQSGALWNEILSETGDVDFYIHSGDICEDTKEEAYWTDMLNGNREYLATKPLMVAPGNHDTTYKSMSNALFKHFNHNIPQQTTTSGYYYSFTYGNTKFIMLNTNLSTSSLPMYHYNWLVDELKNNDAKWTVVTMHFPMYSVGKWGSGGNGYDNGTSLALRTQLNDLFVEYGVDLVIQGHDHTVSKTYPMLKGKIPLKTTQKEEIDGITYDINPQGTVYIMNGPSGNQAREPQPSKYIEKDFYEAYTGGKMQSWAEYRITDTKLTVSVKYLEGGIVKQYFSWGILKSA